MVKLFTPLVLGMTMLVLCLTGGRISVAPELWASSLLAFALLPVILAVIAYRARNALPAGGSITTDGKIRAALVGAGAVLSVGLMLSIEEALGFSEENVATNWGILGTLLLALVAVVVDLPFCRPARLLAGACFSDLAAWPS
jgi:hypothetical protein